MKNIFLIIIFTLFLNSCTDYTGNFNISKDRQNQLNKNLTLDDKKYILYKIFIEDDYSLNRYFNNSFLKNFCSSQYRVNDLYSDQIIYNYLRIQYNQDDIELDNFTDKLIFIRMHHLEFYKNFYHEFKYYIYSFLLLISILVFYYLYIIFGRLHVQNRSLDNKKREIKEILRKIEHNQFILDGTNKSLNRKKLELSEKEKKLENEYLEKIDKINLTPELEKAYHDISKACTKKTKEIKDLKNNFNEIYNHEISLIESKYKDIYSEKTKNFENECKQKYNLKINVDILIKEVYNDIDLISKNLTRVMNNPSNNDQFNKLFKKLERFLVKIENLEK